MKYCLKCENKKVPKGIKFCKECAHLIHENSIYHMRALRCMSETSHANKERDIYGFLSIMHPKMNHMRKISIVNDIK